MGTTQEFPGADARLDDLRRRLYSADATEDDVQRYLDEREATLGGPPSPPSASDATPAHPARRAVAVLGLVLVAGTALTLGVRLGQPTATPTRPVALPARVLQQDGNAGRLLTAGVTGPARIATTIRGTAVIGQWFEGHGRAVVPFDPPAGSTDGGRALVVLTSGGPTAIGWRAIRLRTSTDWSSQPVALARGSAGPGDIVATPTTFVYPGAPPAQIEVEAPDDVRWTLLIAATGRLTTDPR